PRHQESFDDSVDRSSQRANQRSENETIHRGGAETGEGLDPQSVRLHRRLEGESTQSAPAARVLWLPCRLLAEVSARNRERHRGGRRACREEICPSRAVGGSRGRKSERLREA